MLQRRGAHLHVELSRVQLPHRGDVNAVAVAQRGRVDAGDGRPRGQDRQRCEQRHPGHGETIAQ